MEQLANPLSQQAGKWLVIPKGEGYSSSLREIHVKAQTIMDSHSTKRPKPAAKSLVIPRTPKGTRAGEDVNVSLRKFYVNA